MEPADKIPVSSDRVSFSSSARIRLDTGEVRKVRRPEAAAGPKAWVVALILALPALIIGLLPLRFLDEVEWATYDWRMQARNSIAPETLDSRIMLVGITERDRFEIRKELDSRASHHHLLSALREWKAECAVFDIFFESKMNGDDIMALRVREVPTVLAMRVDTNFAAVEPAGPPPPDLQGVVKLLDAEPDAATLAGLLQDQMPQYRDYVEGKIKEIEELGAEPAPETARQIAAELAWCGWLERLLAERWMALSFGRPRAGVKGGRPIIAQSISPLSTSLMMAAKGVGIANIEKKEGAVVRHAPLLFEFDGFLFPNLDLALLCWYYGAPFRGIDIQFGKQITIKPTRNHTESIHIPIDDRGMYLVNYREGEEFLNRRTTPNMLLASDWRYRDEAVKRGIPNAARGAIVLVGETLTGGAATDVEPIPIQNAFPMVGMHANVIDNVLRGDFLSKPRMWSGLAVVLGFGVVMELLFLRLPFKRAAAMTALLLGAYMAVVVISFMTANIVLPIARPLLTSIVWVIALFGYIVGVTERERRMVRDVFLRSVSPRIGEEILRNYQDEAIWGSSREITVLFVDIRGYTTLSERTDAATVLGVLDQFYDTAAEAVFRHDGQVNKYIGDAVMALFGAMPEEPPNHAERALRAALDIQRAMTELARGQQLKDAGVQLSTGAGVNTGEAVTGLVGQRRIRIEFTAIGDAVNVASRLQGLATTNQIVVGRRTLELAGGAKAEFLLGTGARIEEISGVKVKGREGSLTVYRIDLGGGAEKPPTDKGLIE